MTEFISLGENCLPDDVLSYLGLKNESYPFGGGRFNIEYIIQLIETDFEDLLKTEYLVWGKTVAKDVVRNTKYTYANNIYSDTVTLGFEFTHHNVFEEVPRRSFIRKIERFRNTLKSGRNIVFFYNYRYASNNDVQKLIGLISRFLDLVKEKYGHEYKCLVIYQSLNDRVRQINSTRNGNVYVTEFITRFEWEGDEYWNGSPDRDLFKKLFNSSGFNKFVHGTFYFVLPIIQSFKSLARKILRK